MEKDKKNAWKDYLLKSGLPLEFEVKKFLDSKGCISKVDYTYLRNNEHDQSTEFSYDIDSSYIKGDHFMDLMIECKYRHESTKWVFLPESYRSIDGIYETDFMHKSDHFNDGNRKKIDFPVSFGPLCDKGIELTSDGANPKTITQAISQLSYAMVNKIISGMDHQSNELLRTNFKNTIFYSIPVIITTAKLYRIKEDIDIQTIKSAQDISEISTNEPYLVIKTKPGSDLYNYNRLKFTDFIMQNGEHNLKERLNSYSKDIWFLTSNISEHNCPSSIVVIHHDPQNTGLDALFSFLHRVMEPDQEIFDILAENERESEEFFAKFERDHPGVNLWAEMNEENQTNDTGEN
ncbi:hypothetical protein [Pedobacter sp.]|uniref:hypothetical protein n=1 Tax=Pedobacter sp. TaxID=1411316 RepID=UPI0031CFF12F